MNIFRRGSDMPRPPLPGRLIGLATGLLILAGAIYAMVKVFALAVSVVAPLIVIILTYQVILGRCRR